MDRRFEQGTTGEPLGVPTDLFTDAVKYETDIPLWKRTVGFIKQYERSKPKGRDVLFEQLANFAIKDLGALNQIFDNFALASHIRPDLDFGDIASELIKHLEKSASRRSALPTWTPERIETLVRFGLDQEGQIKNAAEAIKRGLFNTPETVKESVDLHYNAAWAMVVTPNAEIREEIFSALCLEKEWFNPRFLNAMCFHFGVLYEGEILSKYQAVRRALRYVGHLFELKEQLYNITEEPFRVADRFRKFESPQFIASLSPDTRKKMGKIGFEIIQKSPEKIDEQMKALISPPQYEPPVLRFEGGDFAERVEALKGLHQQCDQEEREMDATFDKPFRDLADKIQTFLSPQIMKVHIEAAMTKAYKRGYQKLTPVPIQLPEGHLLDIIVQGRQTDEQKKAIIKEVYESIMNGQSANPPRRLDTSLEKIREAAKFSIGFWGPYDQEQNIVINVYKPLPDEVIGRLASVIGYHRPIIGSEQEKTIIERLSELRSDLKTNFTKSIGKRGYTIIISDPILRGIGYQELTFRQENREGKLAVELCLGGQKYEFSIDPNNRLMMGKDFKRVISSQDQAWLELLTLSHLKTIVCTDEDNIQNHLLGEQRQFEVYKKQIVYRTEHLRRLSPGQNFSTEAFSKCLRSHLPMRSLLEINRLRAGINKGGTIQTGIWTYVSGTEYLDAHEAKPVRLAFAKASDDIRKAMNLGQISTEELSRIENEILGELEKN